MIQSPSADLVIRLTAALRDTGFRGEIDNDRSLLAAMSTDNSVYRIAPELVVAPKDDMDCAKLIATLAQPDFAEIPVTPRGGGTGTNGQSLNRGVIVDTRRHFHRLLGVNVQEAWADVEPGLVLDDLNAQLRPHGLFFAPETSTSTRCTIGGMLSTDASGKGSRVYGKTSDNVLGLAIARPEGLLSSLEEKPDWARAMLAQAEAAAQSGRAAFVANTPQINRRFTGYDLERACPPNGGFEWWRLFLGAEGTLGLVTRIRVALRPIEAEKRLLVVGFDSFQNAVGSATPLLSADPTAVEVMDETVQAIAASAGVLDRLPDTLRNTGNAPIAFTFIEINGTDVGEVEDRIAACRGILADLPGARAVHETADLAEIRNLWAIRSAGVALLGKIDGRARPVAFVEDCVVPPAALPAFVEDFRALLSENGLTFGIYGHVDVGCLHFRPALDIDDPADRARLVAMSDGVYRLTRVHGGIFWGEHGKGVRGAYLRDWIGEEAYEALRGVKAAFDPDDRYNPGKLVSTRHEVMGIASTPFRPFNAPDGDPLTKAFRCNGNAQCLSYAAATPMCPSFKATADLRQSPKGRADGLRDWQRLRNSGTVDAELENALLGSLDSCLGCKACASSCPVQVDIPSMRTVFHEDYYSRHRRPLADRLILLTERASPFIVAVAPVVRPFWSIFAQIGETLTGTVDMPRTLARRGDRSLRLSPDNLRVASQGGKAGLPERTVILIQDWFSALFDPTVLSDHVAGLRALGFSPRLLDMRPAGKAALTLGDRVGFEAMARKVVDLLNAAAKTGLPLLGTDPAFVEMLRQDYAKAGFTPPPVLLAQEFLLQRIEAGETFPKVHRKASVRILTHCTEATARPATGAEWQAVFDKIGMKAETPATGCCGMAGLFGHQKRHQAVSHRLFNLSWRDKVAGDIAIAATGYSCRCQSDRLANRSLRHPMALIAQALQPGT